MADPTPPPTLWSAFVDFATSLRLALVLLAFSMLLVFGATLDQTHLGIWGIQEKWFHTFAVRMTVGGLSLPVFPGGYLLGFLLLLNLSFSLLFRMTWSWNRAGLLAAHVGLILLVVGEGLTGLWQEEYRLRLSVGERRTYVENVRELELALVDTSPGDFDQVVAIPASSLARHKDLTHPALPFRVHAVAYYPNALLGPSAPSVGPGLATAGLGLHVTAAPQPETFRPDEENAPAAYVALSPPDGEPVTLLVSTQFQGTQSVTVAGKSYEVALRPARRYLGFALRLLDFTHERYAGTEIPKGFTSTLQMEEKEGGSAREVKVFMNHPLRHEGLTFYQAGFENNDRTSILQVVSNPSWQLPYVACTLVGLGLLWHFVLSLAQRRTRAASSSPGVRLRRPLAARLLAGGAAVLLVAAALLQKPEPAATLPLLANGRIKPLDTVARSSLLLLQGRQRVRDGDGRPLTPTEWLLEVFFRPGKADALRVFDITDTEVQAAVGLSPGGGDGGRRFSYASFAPQLSRLDRQAKLADEVPDALRTPFQNHLLELHRAVALYQNLKYTFLPPGEPALLEALTPAATPDARSELGRLALSLESLGTLHPLPPSGDQGWGRFSRALASAASGKPVESAAGRWTALGLAWQTGNRDQSLVEARRAFAEFRASDPDNAQRCEIESRFNLLEPFYLSMILYVAGFVALLVSWLRWSDLLSHAAYGLVAVAWSASTLGIGCRMWLENRPPVTNLYSSALFVGWGAVGLCLLLERKRKPGLATAAAGLVGFATLLIAHHLSLGGDTMEMMRAVLDSNFWLATHVVTVTVGYSATFLAGFLGLLHLLRLRWTGEGDEAANQASQQMILGVVAVATFFSFVGTVLGGIWADQSWGRFWGWDPKENGALLVVLWNAIVLHARWGGYVKHRGLAALAVFGNVVTAWSWFGVNMLGVGLHSYGFMQAAMWWLVGFAASQLLLIVWSVVPHASWPLRGVKKPERAT